MSYSIVPEAMQWIRQEKVCYKVVRVRESALNPPSVNQSNKVGVRANEVKKLHDMLGNPSYVTMYNMVNHGSNMNTNVSAKDIVNNMDLIKNHPARLLATISDKVQKQSTTVVVGSIGEKVNVDIIFDSYAETYLFMEDRFHKLRIIIKLPSKHGKELVQAFEMIQNVYVKYGHRVRGVMSDNEEVFKSIDGALGAMGIILTLVPSGQHNQIIERSNRTLKEKVEVLKGVLSYELPRILEKDCYYHAVYLLNRTWNSNTGQSTPWEIHSGEKLDLKYNPLVQFGVVVVAYQPISLRSRSHPRRGEIGVVVGKPPSSPKSFLVYIPARGRNVIRGSNFKTLDVIPGQWKWKPNPRFMDSRGDGVAVGAVSAGSNVYGPLYEDSDSDEEDAVEDIDDIIEDGIDDRYQDMDGDGDVEEIDLDDNNNYWKNPYILESTRNTRTRENLARGSHTLMDSTFSGPSECCTMRMEEHNHRKSISNLSLRDSAPSIHTNQIISDDETKKKKDGITHLQSGLAPGVEPANSLELKQAAIRSELKQMLLKDVFETIKKTELDEKYLKNKKIDSLMFSKSKFDVQGVFTKWKSRLAARGDQQDDSTFGNGSSSPTANTISINMLLSLGISKRSFIFTSDVPGAYLHAELMETIIMRLPKSCGSMWLNILEIPESEWNLWMRNGYVHVRLKKALYGLVQSSLLWYENISLTLVNMGFESCINDPCLFHRDIDGDKYYIALYVDDLIHISPNEQFGMIISDQLTSRYGSMDHHYGKNLSFLSLPIQIFEDRIVMDQDAYIQKLLEGLEESCGKELQQYPMAANSVLNDDNELVALNGQDVVSYRSILMSIMFVATRTRADVLFAVSNLATKMSSPTVSDKIALDKLIGYIRAHPSVKITYEYSGGESAKFGNRVEIFIDASWCLYDDAKGQSGCVLKLFGNTIMCKTMKQHILTKSSTESEIVAVDDFLPYGIWLCNLLRELSIYYEGPMMVYQDNTSGVKIINKGHGNFKRTKHFINKFYWIKQYVDDQTIEFVYLPTEEMVADIFTKAIVGHLFYVFMYFINNPHSGGKFKI